MRSMLRNVVIVWMSVVFAAASHASVSFELGDAVGIPGQTVFISWSYTGDGQAAAIEGRFNFSDTQISGVNFNDCLTDFSESFHFAQCLDKNGTGDNAFFQILDTNLSALDSGGGTIGLTIDSTANTGTIIDLEWQTDSFVVDGDPAVNAINGQIEVADATISGNIVDAESGAPISGASVFVGDQAVSGMLGNAAYTGTNVDGDYEVGVPMGTESRSIVIEAGGPGHVPGRVGGSPPTPLCFFNCLGGSGIIDINPGDTLTNQDLALSAGGGVSGTVLAASTNDPIESAFVTVYDQSGSRISYVFPYTDANGDYQLRLAVPAGDYFLVAEGPAAGNFVSQVWENLDCDDVGCQITGGNPVTIPANDEVSGIDFGLEEGATIMGTMPPDSIEGIARLYNAEGRFLNSATIAQSQTDWQFDGLSGGSYYITAHPANEPQPYIPTLHNGLSCPFISLPGCNPARGEPLKVERGSVLSGIEIELQSGGLVQGIIVDAETGEAPAVDTGTFQGFEVINGEREVVGSGRIEESGSDLVLTPVFGIPPGDYFLRTYSQWSGRGIGYTHPSSSNQGIAPGYMDAVSDGLTGGRACAGLKCDLDGLIPFTIVDGQTTDIVLEVSTGSNIDGSIIDINEFPIEDALVKLLDADNRVLATTFVPFTGAFSFGAFPAGNYYLRTTMSGHVGGVTGLTESTAVGGSAFGLAQRPFFDRVHGSANLCSEARCNATDGQAIVLDGVNSAGPIALQGEAGPVISGQLFDAQGERIIYRGHVDVVDSDGVFVGEFRVNPLTGMYQTTALSPGTYFLSPSVSPAFRTVTGTGSATEDGQNSGSSGGLTRTSGDNFPVVIGSSSATADFRLIDTADDDIFHANFEILD